jgi:hypothetical protein
MTQRLSCRFVHGYRLAWWCTLLASCGGTDTAPPPGGADTTAPTVSIGAPAPLANGLTGNVTFSADATDDVGVASVEFQVDGVALSTITSAPYSTTIDSNAFASGQHVLRVRARDAADNASGWVASTVAFGGSRTQPAGFTRNETFVTGLSNATAFAQAPDGRLFVAQQDGALRVVKGGTLVARPFLTLRVYP